MRGTDVPTTCSDASLPHGSGFLAGISTILVSSRPSTSTLVVTKRLCIRGISGSGGEHRSHDFRVCAAAAEVAAHAAANIDFGRAGILGEQGHRGENLARCAEAALERIVLE